VLGEELAPLQEQLFRFRRQGGLAAGQAVILRQGSIQRAHAQIGVGDAGRAAIKEVDRGRRLAREDGAGQVRYQSRLALAGLALDHEQAAVVLGEKAVHKLEDRPPADQCGVGGEQFGAGRCVPTLVPPPCELLNRRRLIAAAQEVGEGLGKRGHRRPALAGVLGQGPPADCLQRGLQARPVVRRRRRGVADDLGQHPGRRALKRGPASNS
jgi:hypothetical protein